MNTNNNVGPLRTVLEEARLVHGYTMEALTVLSKHRDPYRLDTPAGHAEGKWFAEQIVRFVPDGTVHLRGLHYLISSSADVLKRDGNPYRNTDDDWVWLSESAAKAARWLDYVPWDRITDQRNEAPQIFIPDAQTGIVWEPGEGAYINVPVSAEAALPWPRASFQAQQAYRIALFGEKTSLVDVLLPVAKEFDAELLLPTGEASETMVANLAGRIAADGRPAVVFYFSDFDPAGWQMPVSVARKLQAHRDLAYPDLEVEVHAVAMTLEQVQRYGLPSTPLKATERRADVWRNVMGHEQTEIDAMIALHPQELRSLARDAVKPFYDHSLARRTSEVEDEWEAEAARRVEAHPFYQEALTRLEGAVAALRENPTREASEDFEGLQAQLGSQLAAAVELPEIVLPEPVIDRSQVPVPLFTSLNDYVTATRRLIDHKKLNENHD